MRSNIISSMRSRRSGLPNERRKSFSTSAQFERWVEYGMPRDPTADLSLRRTPDRTRPAPWPNEVEHAQALYPVDDFLVNNLAQLPASVRLFEMEERAQLKIGITCIR